MLLPEAPPVLLALFAPARLHTLCCCSSPTPLPAPPPPRAVALLTHSAAVAIPAAFPRDVSLLLAPAPRAALRLEGEPPTSHVKRHVDPFGVAPPLFHCSFTDIPNDLFLVRVPYFPLLHFRGMAALPRSGRLVLSRFPFLRATTAHLNMPPT